MWGLVGRCVLDKDRPLANKDTMKSPRYKRSDVQVTGKSTGYQGYFKLDIYTLRHRRFQGDLGPEIRREIFERGHAVAVLPYDVATDQVILIEQFRPGAFASLSSEWFDGEASPWLYEAVAGIIEAGESPTEVAYRKAIEETGTPLTDLIPVSHFLVSPGGSTESVFLYIGRTDTSSVGGFHGVHTEGEDIRPFVMPLQDAYDGIASGAIANVMTIVALQWLMLNRDDVRSRWA